MSVKVDIYELMATIMYAKKKNDSLFAKFFFSNYSSMNVY